MSLCKINYFWLGGGGGGETDKPNRENFQSLQFYFKPNNLQTELTTNGDAHIALFLKHLECNAVGTARILKYIESIFQKNIERKCNWTLLCTYPNRGSSPWRTGVSWGRPQ